MKSNPPVLEVFPGRLRRKAWQAFVEATQYKLTPTEIVNHVRQGCLWHLTQPGAYRGLELSKRLSDFCAQSPTAAEQLAERALATRRAAR